MVAALTLAAGQRLDCRQLASFGPHDSWIAASAVACNCDLLTTNAIEFRRVPQLRVIDYLEVS